MHSASDMRSHLEHRKSILHEFVTNRRSVSRNGANCYFDATLITCRSLWALLGVSSNSRSETDLKTAVGTKLSFADLAARSARDCPWLEIRANIAPEVVIEPFRSEAELDTLPEKKEIVKVLAAANKCVAHFADILHHGVDEYELESVARRLLDEITRRIKIPA
ncbi:MAG: hypothetical protein Q7S40_09130 [Opitutaceae bacterium]|nr:hypothetical protein [Opitutaceae bacterium]